MHSLIRFSLLALFAGLVVPSASAQAPDSPKVRVFTAGHSFHLPMVKPLAEIMRGAQAEDFKQAGTQMIGGSTVSQHWDKPDAANAAKKAILAKEVDVLTLSPHYKVPDPAIDKFVDLLLENNPKGRVLLQESWLTYDGSVFKPQGFTNASRDDADADQLRKRSVPYYEKFGEQVKAINTAHAEKSGRQVLFVVPAGEAVYRLRGLIKKGEVPGITKQSALFLDELGHGGSVMAVLTAYCHYAVIYGKSPVGLPVPEALKKANLGDNTDKVNRILQECAWGAAQDEPLSGVKGVK